MGIPLLYLWIYVFVREDAHFKLDLKGCIFVDVCVCKRQFSFKLDFKSCVGLFVDIGLRVCKIRLSP